jgi:hypothetical protein
MPLDPIFQRENSIFLNISSKLITKILILLGFFSTICSEKHPDSDSKCWYRYM